MAGQLSTLSKLGASSHFDLQLVSVGEIVGGDTNERPDAICLMAGRPHSVPIVEYGGAFGVFATLTSVRLALKTIHGIIRIRSQFFFGFELQSEPIL